MSASEETRDVLRAQAGDRQALEALLARLAPPLRAYHGRLAPAHAEDLLQDVLVLVYRKLDYLHDPRLLRPWAYRIASREAFRQLRRERARGAPEDPAVLETMAGPEPPADPELARIAAGLLEGVPPASRAALVLHYLHELSFGEVASVLEVPIGTVKSRINYGLALLRRAMAATEKP